MCRGHYERKFIFECNLSCLCRGTCRNRLVQKGLTLKLNVVWTGGRGWGLQTLQAIEKGQFVVEFAGQICTNRETMWRIGLRSSNGWYSLSLDAEWRAEAASNDDTALNIDGVLYGNVARFLNHRCEDANLVDVPVRIEQADPRLYHVAFFACRYIEPGEELTWV